MKEEIKIGDFVRYSDGIITKVNNQNEVDIDNYSLKETKIITKYSKNILDLIEDEDIVILEYKTPRYRARIQRKFIVSKIDDFINFENRHCNFTYKVGDKKIVDKICKNIKIKQILTAEQFNTRCYRLED